MSNLNEEEMEEYRKSVLEYEDVQDAIKYAGKRSFEEGEKIGEKRGEKRGRKEGEVSAKRMMAFRMLAHGFPVDTICDLTGLTEEEIRGIMAENNA